MTIKTSVVEIATLWQFPIRGHGKTPGGKIKKVREAVQKSAGPLS